MSTGYLRARVPPCPGLLEAQPEAIHTGPLLEPLAEGDHSQPRAPHENRRGSVSRAPVSGAVRGTRTEGDALLQWGQDHPFPQFSRAPPAPPPTLSSPQHPRKAKEAKERLRDPAPALVPALGEVLFGPDSQTTLPREATLVPWGDTPQGKEWGGRPSGKWGCNFLLTQMICLAQPPLFRITPGGLPTRAGKALT